MRISLKDYLIAEGVMPSPPRTMTEILAQTAPEDRYSLGLWAFKASNATVEEGERAFQRLSENARRAYYDTYELGEALYLEAAERYRQAYKAEPPEDARALIGPWLGFSFLSVHCVREIERGFGQALVSLDTPDALEVEP